MRVVVLALALSLGACADEDKGLDDCHDENGNPTNDIGCQPPPRSVDVTTRWSFETVATGAVSREKTLLTSVGYTRRRWMSSVSGVSRPEQTTRRR